VINIQFVPLLNNAQALTLSQLDQSIGIGTLSLQQRISNSEPTQNFKLIQCSESSGYFIEYAPDSRFIIQVLHIFEKYTI